MDRLEDSGHSFTLVEDDDVQTSDANGKDMVIISSTVSSGKVNSKFTNTALPVITWEPWLYDDLKMTGNSVDIDFGSYSTTKKTNINAAGHPLAAGFTGQPDLFNGYNTVSYGAPNLSNPDLLNIASVPGNNHKLMVFAYDTGAQMEGNHTAPGRRLALFMKNGTASSMAANAWAMFDAGVAWASGCGAVPSQLVADEQAAANQSMNERGEEVDEAIVEEVISLEMPVVGETLQDFKVFPNPATDFTTLDLQGFDGQQVVVTIMDVRGQVVIRREIGISRTSESYHGFTTSTEWYVYRNDSNRYRNITR